MWDFDRTEAHFRLAVAFRLHQIKFVSNIQIILLLLVALLIGSAIGLSVGPKVLEKLNNTKQTKQRASEISHLNDPEFRYFALPIAIGIALFALIALALWAIGFDVWDPHFWRDPEKLGGGAEAIRNFVFAVGALAAIPIGLLTLGNAIRRSKAMDATATTAELRLQTETFAKSVELLSTEQFAQILGGIYSLERQALESEDNKLVEQIESTLVSYLHSLPDNLNLDEANRIRTSVLDVFSRSLDALGTKRVRFDSECKLPDGIELNLGKRNYYIEPQKGAVEVVGSNSRIQMEHFTHIQTYLDFKGSFDSISIYGVASDEEFDDRKESVIFLGDSLVPTSINSLFIGNTMSRVSFFGEIEIQSMVFFSKQTLNFEACDAHVNDIFSWFSALDKGDEVQIEAYPRHWNHSVEIPEFRRKVEADSLLRGVITLPA